MATILGIVVAGTDGMKLSRAGARKLERFRAIPGTIIAALAGAVVYFSDEPETPCERKGDSGVSARKLDSVQLNAAQWQDFSTAPCQSLGACQSSPSNVTEMFQVQ